MSATTINATAHEAARIARFASILKAAGHPSRLGVIQLLSPDAELTVTELCQQLDTEQSLLSHHLSHMRKCGLLSVRREGRHIYYSLAIKELNHLLECMRACGDKLFE